MIQRVSGPNGHVAMKFNPLDEQTAMGVHRPLRRSSRSTRIEERGEIVLDDALAELRLVRAVDQRLVAVGNPDTLQFHAGGGGILVGEQDRGTGVREDLDNLWLGEARVDRDQDEPGGRHGEEQLKVLLRVQRVNRDAVALLQPQIAQRASQPAASLAQARRM